MKLQRHTPTTGEAIAMVAFNVVVWGTLIYCAFF